jgi:hypothetical protein
MEYELYFRLYERHSKKKLSSFLLLDDRQKTLDLSQSLYCFACKHVATLRDNLSTGFHRQLNLCDPPFLRIRRGNRKLLPTRSLSVKGSVRLRDQEMATAAGTSGSSIMARNNKLMGNDPAGGEKPWQFQ